MKRSGLVVIAVDSISRWLVSRPGLLVALALLAASTRLLPLAMSPYPFNNDGMTESRIAGDIVDAGSLDYPDGSFYADSHSAITPIHNIMLAFVSAFIEVDSYDVAQPVVSVLAIVTVLVAYILGYRLTGSRMAAFVAGLFLCLFGTFAFLTSSAWKASLGVALFLMLIYAYANRSDRRMFCLQLAILVLLPFTHHLVTAIALLALAYMTFWSSAYAIMRRRLTRRHAIDAVVVLVPLLCSYLYYESVSLHRISYFDDVETLILLPLSFLLLASAMVLALSRRTHYRTTLAAIPAAAVFVLFGIDYYNPVFGYAQGAPSSVVVLAVITSVFVGISWYGLEVIAESTSRYRAIPIGVLLPFCTLALFAAFVGFGYESHQIVFRTFDFADIAIGLGIAVAVGHLARRPNIMRSVVATVMVALLISFPFGYATDTLTGVRHDTQEYEIDAISWVYDSSDGTAFIRSDERISFVARAILDFQKNPGLPHALATGGIPSYGAFNLLEEGWTVTGVNDYPFGRPVLDTEHVMVVLSLSDVVYIGGPPEDSVIVFLISLLGVRQVAPEYA